MKETRDIEGVQTTAQPAAGAHEDQFLFCRELLMGGKTIPWLSVHPTFIFCSARALDPRAFSKVSSGSGRSSSPQEASHTVRTTADLPHQGSSPGAKQAEPGTPALRSRRSSPEQARSRCPVPSCRPPRGTSSLQHGIAYSDRSQTQTSRGDLQTRPANQLA